MAMVVVLASLMLCGIATIGWLAHVHHQPINEVDIYLGQIDQQMAADGLGYRQGSTEPGRIPAQRAAAADHPVHTRP